ncbi:MAG: RnfABCDGE type electron transport complex subunit G [Paludibacter sp.]|nr:RnfABCDGE type electron transport complex subunit G [Paludibacter sp.]
MKKLKSNFINMVVVLTGIALFAAFTLASVYSLTRDSIESSRNSKVQEAIQAVMPAHDHYDSIPVEMNNGVETTRVYKAYDKNNALVGAAVESSSNNGYKGHIDIIVGFNRVGVIVNYVVLDQHETLGLGSRMIDWFKTDNANQSIIGKNASTAHLNVKVDGGEVDAITAATISSRAFLFAIRNAYFEFKLNMDAAVDVAKAATDSISLVQNDSDTIVTKIEMKGQDQ